MRHSIVATCIENFRFYIFAIPYRNQIFDLLEVIYIHRTTEFVVVADSDISCFTPFLFILGGRG